ncbi:hypothetical protein J7443_16835 [Tropicibacter sp. R15_0]|uniref:hypothetical protein n=1 Tax=Tropicibacter sp. R15_0 TaxID=2821101 RepID=UPI001ADB9686|nr:hypothetical protein [Tropicibacter sp. R15_0]MBO9466913.1 hypothetical protein [Tropicibacter sp. R15_0]
MIFSGFALVLQSALTITLALCLLGICLHISKDHRKRRAYFHATRDLSKADLYEQFERSMWLVARFRSKAKTGRPPRALAENALTLATVLREHIEERSGRRQFTPYLRSRRQLINEAKTCAKKLDKQ